MWRTYILVLIYAWFSSSDETRLKNVELERTCSLNVDEDLTKTNQPLMLAIKNHKEYELLLPEKNEKKSVINLHENEHFVLFCPGENNVLKKLSMDAALTTCQRNQLQLLEGPRIVKGTKEFQCDKQLTPEIKNTGNKCGDDSEANIFEIGYQVHMDKENTSKWFEMLSACHNVETMDTLYTTYIMYGKSIDARQKNVPRPREFMVGNLKELYDGNSPNDFYTKRSVEENLKTILNRKNVRKYFDSTSKYISRGHLAPDADMLFSGWKIATYLFINVAPQWQNINAGNWLKVENKVRKAAQWSQDDFIVITGTYGVMQLLQQPIYLNPPNQLRVPNYFWKVIYSESKKAAIAIITSNNPYLKNIQTMCTDVCKSSGWWSKGFKNIKKGYTYCCTYSDFKNVVKYVPNLDVQEELRMPDNPSYRKLKSIAKQVFQNAKKLIHK